MKNEKKKMVYKKENDETAWSAPTYDWDEILPGLSKEFYQECADWDGRKEHLVGLLKHYWHGQTHRFDELCEVQILFRPLTVRLVTVANDATALMAVERMAYMLEDMSEDDEFNIDVKLSLDGAELITPSMRFDTYYFERTPPQGSTPSDEHGPLSPEVSSALSHGVSMNAVEVV